MVDEIWHERPTHPDVYLYLGELYELHDDLARATRWFTAGAMRAMRNDRLPLHHLAMLFIARRRVRLAQGFTENDYDIIAGEMKAKMAGG